MIPLHSATSPSVVPTLGDDDAGDATDAVRGAASALVRLRAALTSTGLPAPSGAAIGAEGRPAPGAIDNANGAPSLAQSTLIGSAEDLALMLQTAQDHLLNQRLSSAKSAIDVASNQAAVQNREQAQKVQDWIRNSEKAHQKSSGFAGWLGSILKTVAAVVGVVVAAIATAATGGAAAPVLVVACIGLASASMNLASQISVAAGGPDLTLTKLLTQGGTRLFEAFGMGKEDAEKAGGIFAGTVGVVTGAALIDPGLIGVLAVGVAKAAGANADTVAIVGAVVTTVAVIAVAIAMGVTGNVGSAAGAAATAASGALAAAKTASTVMGGVASVTQGVDRAVQGVQTISNGRALRAVGDAQADMKENTAKLLQLQNQMEQSRDEIKKVVAQFQSAFLRLSDMLESASQSSRQINHNLVPVGA